MGKRSKDRLDHEIETFFRAERERAAGPLSEFRLSMARTRAEARRQEQRGLWKFATWIAVTAVVLLVIVPRQNVTDEQLAGNLEWIVESETGSFEEKDNPLNRLEDDLSELNNATAFEYAQEETVEGNDNSLDWIFLD